MERVTCDSVVGFIKNHSDQLGEWIHHKTKEDFYEVFMTDLPQFLKNSIDAKNEQDLQSGFRLLNELIPRLDDYMFDIMYQTVMESLALSGKKYYE